MPESRTILAVLEDLFFTVKINEAAKRAGMPIEFAKSEHDALDKARTSQPALIVLDLNFTAIDPLGLIAKLKADSETQRIREGVRRRLHGLKVAGSRANWVRLAVGMGAGGC